jgi:hypothetical protein
LGPIYTHKDAGSLVADPQFTNLSTFALAATAPALATLGFTPIDISEVGPAGMSGGVPPGACSAKNAAAVSDVVAALAAPELQKSGLVAEVPRR